MSENNNLEVVKNWIKAANAHDPQQIGAALYPTEFVWELGTNSTKRQGSCRGSMEILLRCISGFSF